MKKISGSVLACMAALTMHAATNDGLLFYCSFDGSATATFARGGGGATSAAPPEFQPGVRGQALVIGGSTAAVQRIVGDLPANSLQALSCYYSPDKNLDVQKGSVSFWLKPLDWDGKTKGFNVFFRAGIGPNYFMLYKFFSGDQFVFLRGEQEKGLTAADHRIRNWKPGQWHHVAATWSSAELRMFIDGARVCTRKIRVPFESLAPAEPFSVGPGGSWSKAFIGRSLVDELRIHSRPLSDEDIVRLYRQDSANVQMDAGLVTVGERTPALDGAISGFEYAFAGAGFSDMKGFLSRQQSRYFLSYDRTNLYVAVRSEINPDKAAQPMDRDGAFASSERVEVLLVSGSAGKTFYHFVFTPSGGMYDGKNGDKLWNSAKALVKNVVSSNVWIMETAIPFADLGLERAPDDQSWKINIGRVFTAPETATSAAPVKGSLDDLGQFITLVFQPDAPGIQIAGLIDLEKYISVADISARSSRTNSAITLVIISDTTKDYGLSSLSRELFARGKSTPFRAPQPPGQPWQLKDFALSEMRITETLDGKETMLYRAQSICEEQTPLKTFFLYTQDRKRLFISALRRADGKIQARFLRPDGTCAFQASQNIPSDTSYFNALFDLDFNKLTPGDYTIKVDYVAPDGKTTESYEQAYRIPGKDSPEFCKYVDVEADKVPAPWTALKSAKDKVEMWGRTYDFSKGFLFSSLVSQGKEILAGPAVLRIDGITQVPAEPVVLKKVSGSDMAAEWEKSADLGKLKVESKIKTHFDGYCEIAMTLSPAGKDQEVKTLSLDIPLRGEVAALVRDGKLGFLGGSKSGAVSNYWCQDLIDNPFLWVGNEKVGFNWLAPSLEAWHCRRNDKNVEIIREGDTAILRFNLVDAPLKLEEPRTIKFGFALTPTRPLDMKIQRLRDSKDLQWACQPWEYFAVPDYDAADRSAIARASAQNGLNPKEVFLYFGDGLTSPFCPEWAFWEEEWRPLGGSRAYGEWTGDVKDPKIRGRNCYVEGCIKSATYFNFMQHKRSAFFIRAKTPLAPQARNYYFDTGVGAYLCSNARHGCVPWTGLDGKKHGRMPVDEYREQALNVYRMIRRTGPDAKIWGHQGWLRVMPMQHFADIISGGEGVDGSLSKDGGYYNILTPEMFRATFLPQIWGIKMVFLYMGFGNDTEKNLNFSMQNPADRRSVLHAYGYCLVHDVDLNNLTPLAYKLIQELKQPLWAAQDKLGWDEQVVFHPYWEPGAVKLVSPQSNRIMASAYTRNGKMLLAVLNDTDQEQNVKLDLDLNKLGVKEGLQGSDVWQPEATYTLSSSWEGKMPPRGFRLVVWPNSAN